jgi:glycosyltransferase involved in cell wall biosynthesis
VLALFSGILTPSYFPIVGGVETHIRCLTKALRSFGVSSEVVVFCDTKKWESSRRIRIRTVDEETVVVWPSFPTGKFAHLTKVHYLPSLPFGLRGFVERFDIVHFHDDIDLSFPLSLRGIRKPKIFSCHSMPYTLDFYSRQPLSRRLLTTSSDLFHVFTRYDAKSLEGLGVEARKIRVIPNFIDVTQFKSSRKNSQDVIRIAWYGRISRSKGVIILLEAFNLLKREFPNLELMIGGEVWDDRYFRELVDYTREMGLRRVQFTGFVSDVPSFLQRADIFVLPSFQETFGIVNLEAMASGLPVVASSISGIPEIVIDHVSGFLVPPGDPVKLAKKLRVLIVDRKLRRDMGRNGRERVLSTYSVEKVSKEILDMYKELI